MRRTAVLTALVVSALTIPAAFADYYATKADYRNGILTPGGPPVPEDGTDTCAAPTVIPGIAPAGMYNDSGTTVGKTNTVNSLPLACNGNYTTVAGPDAIYTFTTSASGTDTPTFLTQTTEPNYDMSIYILTTCNNGTTCVVGADNCFAQNAPGNPCGAVSDEQISSAALAASTTYFFYVDSFYAVGGTRDDGPYTLTVTGPLPVELVEFSID